LPASASFPKDLYTAIFSMFADSARLNKAFTEDFSFSEFAIGTRITFNPC